MKVPRYIFIRLNGFKVETLLDLFDEKCAHDWNISAGLDKYTAVPDEKLFCSKCGKVKDSYGSRLSLYLKDSDTLCVQNIMAYDSNESSCYRCDRILEGFFENIVRPSIAGLAVQAELTTEELFLPDLVGPKAAALLTKFSRLANKATGSCHPCDRRSWLDFILAAHEAGATLSSDILIATLEEQGWSKEAARDLGAEFEFGMTLLDYREGRGP